MITALLHDVIEVTDLAGRLSSIGKCLLVITPSKPWLDVSELESAYVMYRTFSSSTRKLRRSGA